MIERNGTGISGETRTCTRCGETLSIEEFQLYHRSEKTRRRQCRECCNAASRLSADTIRNRAFNELIRWIPPSAFA